MRFRVLAVLALAAVCAAAGALALSRGASVAPTGLRDTGPAPAGQQIRFALVLRLHGARRLKATLAGIENPRSPSFRRFIDPRTFGARFGISTARLHRLARQLAAGGVSVVASYPQRTSLSVSGTVRAVSRLLGVRLETFTDPAGHRFHAPLGRISVPRSLADAVVGVTGLDTRRRWISHDVPMGGLSPGLAASAYDIAPLHAAGSSGRGRTIAIISFSAFDPADPAAFAASQGITGPPPRVVAVDGGTNDTSGAIEANLDIDNVRAIAPQAQVVVYEVPQSDAAYADAINRIVADRIDVISSSWGQCELEVAPSEMAGETQALSAAVAAGVTMFVSSGDSGAYDCQQSDPGDHRLTVDWPASSTDAVSVGGTRLYLGGSGQYISEAAWEDTLSQAGGGGGLSRRESRPSWQTGPGVLNRFSDGRRQVPDVSADADPGTPWGIYAEGQPGEVGGTSAAAPFWAASMLLVGQYAGAHGIRHLGYLDPVFYALASTPQPFRPFHDVIRGGNRFYEAARGWDFATGLGTPDVFNLARDVVAYLRSRRAP
jgi:subtilase family serine protease